MLSSDGHDGQKEKGNHGTAPEDTTELGSSQSPNPPGRIGLGFPRLTGKW